MALKRCLNSSLCGAKKKRDKRIKFSIFDYICRKFSQDEEDDTVGPDLGMVRSVDEL